MLSTAAPYFAGSSAASPAGLRKLVVLLHAYTASSEVLRWVRQAVADTFPAADTWVPDLPLQTWSTANPNAIVQQLLHGISDLWTRQQSADEPYDSITLIGHSVGALLARKVYVCACGSTANAPLEPEFATAPAEWSSRVERLILLAGMNRGWTISHHVSLQMAIMMRVGTLLGTGYQLLRGRKLLVNHARQGSPFVTQLRLQWLAMRQRAGASGAGAALTVQLLGTKDDLVAPQDNIDLVTGSDFVYLDVPNSGHRSVVEMDPADHATGGAARYALFTQVLGESDEALRQRSVSLTDLQALGAQPDVTDVIFVIHGIRDEGFWTQKVARRIRETGRRVSPERVFATETSSYGYFPMLPFLLSWGRRDKVEWLMDQYTENKALYPNARFSYVGHSNGTYLLAKALQEYPAARFHHVVFAGSVVRTDYQWEKIFQQGRVAAVLNYVATADWVVAFFPKSLQTLRWQDLGSAGHDGFQATSPLLQQAKFVRGGHSAALEEANWDAIADFVVSGPAAITPGPVAPPLGGTRSSWISALSRIPILLVLVLGLALLVYFIWRQDWPATTRLLALLLLFGVLWKGVTWL